MLIINIIRKETGKTANKKKKIYILCITYTYTSYILLIFRHFEKLEINVCVPIIHKS